MAAVIRSPLSRFVSATAVVVVLNAPWLCAQSASPGADTPSFEVASIKPNNSGSPMVMMVPQPGGRFTATNVSVRMLILNAYQLPFFRVEGGPDWIQSDRFDVAAKAEGDPPPDQMRLMLQKLLADRFKLNVHRETREMPVFRSGDRQTGWTNRSAAASDEG